MGVLFLIFCCCLWSLGECDGCVLHLWHKRYGTNQFLVGSKARIMEWKAHLKQLKRSWNCGYIDPIGESNAINELNEYSIKMTPNDQWEKTTLKRFCKVFLFRRWKIIQWHHSENKRVDKYITALTPVLRDLCGKRG